MKRILVAYDDTDCSQTALTELPRAGLPPELEVMVLSVADVWMPEDGDLTLQNESNLPENVRKARTRARQQVEAQGQLASKGAEQLQMLFPKWSIQAVASAGSPSFVIIQKAREWQADLVLVGSHGRNAVGRFLLGSVAQTVAANAECSVRVTRPGASSQARPSRIALAFDGSPDSRKAIQTALLRGWPAGTLFQIWTILDARMESAVCCPTLYADEWTQQHDANVTEWICRLAEEAASQFKEKGWSIETHIFEGEPKHKLIEQAESWKSDCLFLGAQGLDHGDRRYLGSTASALLHRAPCAVELIR